MSHIMVERVINECSKQQIKSALLEEITPEKSDLRYYMPIVASSLIYEESIEIMNTIKILLDGKRMNEPDADEKAKELYAKYELLDKINKDNDYRMTVLICMEDTEPETPTKFVCVYGNRLLEYRYYNKKNMASFIYREAHDIKANYEGTFDAAKKLKHEIHEYLENR